MFVSVVTGVSGLVTYFLTGSGLFSRLSFDSMFLFPPVVSINEVVVVKLGEDSFHQLHQEYDRFSRALHARLLEKLAKDGTKLVVFDIVFDGARPEDEELARAISAHGNVVTGMSIDPVRTRQVSGTAINVGAFYGVPGSQSGAVEVPWEKDLVIRRFPLEKTNAPSLSTVAARAYGKVLDAADTRRWIAFYGTNAFTEMEFHAALDEAKGFFRDKVVFIGGRPKTKFVGEEADSYAVATTRWTGEALSGVDIQATMFLNLIRDEWLRELGPTAELMVVLAGALVIGFAVALLRPIPGFFVAAGLSLGVFAGAVLLCWGGRTWFNWLVLSGVEAPVAWLTSVVLYARRLERAQGSSEKAAAAPRDAMPSSTETLPEPPCEARVVIRDYELLTCVGRGGYGEVWLARSATGALKAVKIVFRGRFADERPFLREFQGLKHFEPISRLHPGWVSILHVAKDESAGHFYYVMDPADDLVSGQEIEPSRYQPKTLENLLSTRGVLSVRECVELGIEMADALGALHQRELIHRDVKPSNIVYIGGQPRLADIGLVAPIGKSTSYVGTEGYLPPEGPGSPLADIYSLGRVLHQAAIGMKCKDAERLRAALDANGRDRDLARFLEVAEKACASFHGKRYQSALELREALSGLKKELQVESVGARID